MDFYGDSGKLSFGDGPGLEYFLEETFAPSSPHEHPSSVIDSTGLDSYSMDPDWLDSFLEDPVLNDRMMSDALQPPQPIQNEHSYSLANNDHPDVDHLKTEPMDTEVEQDLLRTTSKALNLTIHRQNQSQAQQEAILVAPKQEPADDPMHTLTVTTSKPGQTILRQPTIILATTSTGSSGTVTTATLKQTERLVLPKVNIKLEPSDEVSGADSLHMYESLSLPPTPPGSSSSSDSEGGMSPQRSAPSSPIRQLHMTRHQSLRAITHSPTGGIFSSPIPTSGVLILSEEEKRTLISEGYPIPTKLPLTKQEEKNLKKVRRKIKNKISAQESRRKKKEYLETLEKKVEAYNQENVDLKRKMESLETNNRSLLSQLHKLQSLVGKVKTNSGVPQASTCLMVLVLCFAVFLGSWSSGGLANLGYSTSTGLMAPQSVSLPVGKVSVISHVGPKVEDATVDAYSTPNMRSRVLLSMLEEEDGEYGPATPLSYRDLFFRFFCSSEDGAESGSQKSGEVSDGIKMEPPNADTNFTGPKSVIVEGEAKSVNDTAEKQTQYVPMHPDIMADVRANVVPVEKRQMSGTIA